MKTFFTAALTIVIGIVTGSIPAGIAYHATTTSGAAAANVSNQVSLRTSREPHYTKLSIAAGAMRKQVDSVTAAATRIAAQKQNRFLASDCDAFTSALTELETAWSAATKIASDTTAEYVDGLIEILTSLNETLRVINQLSHEQFRIATEDFLTRINNLRFRMRFNELNKALRSDLGATRPIEESTITMPPSSSSNRPHDAPAPSAAKPADRSWGFTTHAGEP